MKDVKISSHEGISHSDIELSDYRNRNDLDNLELSQLGKKPVLKRNFGFVSMLAFACTVMLTWEALLLLFPISFLNGGYAGAVYEYLFVWIGTISAITTMGELASMAPTAGGQYHWVSMLAPPSSRKFLSYLIGWLTVTGWQAVCASGCYLCAELIEGLVVLRDPHFKGQPWQIMLLCWAAMTISVLVNTIISKLLPRVESLMLILHVFGFFGILIPLTYFAPHGTAETVFTEFMNEGGWPTQGLSFMVGCVAPAFVLLGADCATHMSEEIQHPAKNVPRAMVSGILLNGSLGFAMLLAVMFCLGDPGRVLSTPTGYAFMAVFDQAVGSTAGATTMSAVVTTMNFSATISSVATASRLTWAFARDRGIPGWGVLSQVEPRSTLPLNAIALTAAITFLLSFIGLGSTVAFNDVVSLSINGLYTSYLLGNGLLLYRRMTGSILPYNSEDRALKNTIEADQLTWGPWHIREPFGTIVNGFGCAYMVVMLFFSFWPVMMETTAESMNYSVLMTGAVVIFSLIYYFAWGNRDYKGPLVEV